MSVSFVTSELAARLYLRRFVLVIFTVSVFLNMVLTGLLLFKDNVVTTVLVPIHHEASEASWLVSENKVSSDYLNRVARDLLVLATHSTPVNVDYNRQALLKYVSPKSFGTIEAELLNQAQELKQKRATYLFDVTAATTDTQNLTVRFDGLKRVFIGERETERKNTAYQLSFNLVAGRLYLNAFTEIGFNQAKPH